MKFYMHKYPHSDLIEMAEVGRIGKCKISVYGNEGPVPHFHFFDVQTKRKGCIRIDKAEYFKHGKYHSTLDGDEVENLAEWLNQPHQSFGKVGYTNWMVICIYWDDNNPRYKLPDDIQMPDYNNL